MRVLLAKKPERTNRIAIRFTLDRIVCQIAIHCRNRTIDFSNSNERWSRTLDNASQHSWILFHQMTLFSMKLFVFSNSRRIHRSRHSYSSINGSGSLSLTPSFRRPTNYSFEPSHRSINNGSSTMMESVWRPKSHFSSHLPLNRSIRSSIESIDVTMMTTRSSPCFLLFSII